MLPIAEKRQPADPPARPFDGRPRRAHDARERRRAQRRGRACASTRVRASSCWARRTAARTRFPRMLIGRDALVKKLALVDLRSDHAGAARDDCRLRRRARTCCRTTAALDLFDRAVWERLLDADAPETAASSAVASPRRSRPASGGPCRDAASALAKARELAAAIRDEPARSRRGWSTSPAPPTRPPAIS